MKKNFKGLPELTAEIDALRKSRGLAPLEEKPKTLSEAKDILAAMKRPSKPSVKQAVAIVSKKAADIPNELSALQAQLDATEGVEARVRLLNAAAKEYRAKAATMKACSLEWSDAYKTASKIERRAAYELLAAGKLQSAFKAQPEDLD